MQQHITQQIVSIHHMHHMLHCTCIFKQEQNKFSTIFIIAFAFFTHMVSERFTSSLIITALHWQSTQIVQHIF